MRFSACEVIWRRIMDDNSFETCRIADTVDGAQLSGTILVAEDGTPAYVDYRIVCDAEWRTRLVDVTQSHAGQIRDLTLHHDGAGTWQIDGAPAPQLDGCMDVDLGWSPSTNALPLNRLGMLTEEPGCTGSTRAAWIRFPAMSVEGAEQTYELVKPGRFRYRSLASGFTALITVDDLGLPLDYEGVWQRRGTGPVSPAARREGFARALISTGPAPQPEGREADLDWLVGGWNATVIDHLSDGQTHESTGEWWFHWVLDGQVLQDVWIAPRREDRHGLPPGHPNRYGSTLRYFDRENDEWRIFWLNPVTGITNRLSGSRDGNQMVLTGQEDGQNIRWRFEKEGTGRFHWFGETELPDGSWRLEAEFHLQQIV